MEVLKHCLSGLSKGVTICRGFGNSSSLMFEQGMQYSIRPQVAPNRASATRAEHLWKRQWLGEVPYLEALSHQHQLREEVKRRGQGVIIGLEHPRVITLGLHMKHQQFDAPKSAPPIFKTDRGGQATLHNSGQLVIYPILPIREWKISVREYVQLLLRTTENFCVKCNIIVIPKPNGVYSAAGKIASVGINIKQGISTHGLSINIDNNLSEFAFISPCGVVGQAMDSVGNYKKITLLAAFEMWCSEFQALIQSNCP